jgi:hypothetical protein
MAIILVKRGTSDPTASQVTNSGELAANTSTPKLFIKTASDSSTTPVWIGAAIEASPGDWTNASKLATQSAINTTFMPKGGGTFTGDLTLNAQSDLRFADSDSSNWVAFQAPSTVASNVTWTLPSADGTNGQILSTNGSGTLSWASGGSATTIDTTNDNTNTSRYIVFSTSAQNGATLYVDSSTTPLSYNPSTPQLSVGNAVLQGSGNGILYSNTVSTLQDDQTLTLSASGSDTAAEILLTGSATTASTAAISATTTTVTSTTVNLDGAIATTGSSFELPTSYTFSDTGTATNTLNIQTGVTTSGATKTLNIGTGGAAGSTTNVNIGSANGGTVTINSDATISGNLTVSGNTTTVSSTTITVNDPLISLASNNGSTDAVDIGFYGLYDTSGSQDLYCGLFRDASDDKFKLFKSLQSAPTTTVNTGGTGYAVSTLVADLEGKVNGLTVTSSTGTLTVTNGKTLSASNTLTFTGTDSSSVAFGGGGTVAYTSNNLGAFSATTSAQLAGVINDETGFTSGALLVFNTSPSFTTSVVTGSTTFGVFDSTATTIDAFGAATTGNIGYDGTSSSTTNISTGAVGLGNTKTLNLGTGAAASSQTYVNIGSANGGSVTINSTALLFAGASMISTAPGIGSEHITIAPQGEVRITPSDGLNVGGTRPQLIVQQPDDGVSQVQVTGGDLYLGRRSTNGSTFLGSRLIFEGSTNDGNETFLTCTDPTADQTITLPDATGTVITTGNLTSITATGTITSGTWNGTDIALADGGTNASLTAANGGIVYSTASAMAISSVGTSGQFLTSGGAGAPTWTSESSITAGNATVAATVTLTATNSTDATHYLVFSDAATGNENMRTDTSLYYNPSTNVLTAGTVDAIIDGGTY